MNAPPSAIADKYGVIHDPRLDRWSRFRIGLSIFVPLLAGAFALADLPETAPTSTTLIVFLVFFTATAIGINLGLHRYFTHASFKASAATRFLIATFASFAMQGPIAIWVADHRRHHRFPDRPGDPHSPYWIGEQQIRSRIAGFWHAHFLWMFRAGQTDVKRYASDILADRFTGWQSRHYGIMCLLALGLPAVVGGFVGGIDEAIRCFLWAGCVKVTTLHEITRAVNSFGHMFGRKERGAKDESRNNPWLFWLWLGEGLHGFHHRHPLAALMEPVTFDPMGLLIIVLERLGIVWDVRRASPTNILGNENVH